MARHVYRQNKACSAPGCTDIADHNGKGGYLCDSHYQRLLKRGTLEAHAPSRISRKPEYRHWINMKSRCNTESSTGFEHYGGRRIKVHPAWEASFDAFYRDMGPRPSPRHSVDRIDVNGDYERGNCQWATKKAQARNMRSNRIVHVDGESMTLAEAVEKSGLIYSTVLHRLMRGWDLATALKSPPHKGVRP